MIEEVAVEFGGRIRVRVCGLFFKDERILLLNHSGLYGHDFWAPPGGGVNFGEPLENALKREFMEECHLEIRVKRFLFGCEYIKNSLNAIELFFEVEGSGLPVLGKDPEIKSNQLITDLQFIGTQQLTAFPTHHAHGIFRLVDTPLKLIQLKGFFYIT